METENQLDRKEFVNDIFINLEEAIRVLYKSFYCSDFTLD